MASLFGLLGIVQSGASAQQGAVGVVAQNVSGASTAGYVRRSPILQERAIGGVQLQSVERAFDRFAFGAAVAERGKLGSSMARSEALTDLQSRLGLGSGANLADRMQAVFEAFNALTARPDDTTLRGEVLAKADAFASAVSDSARTIQTYRADMLGKAQDTVATANQQLSRVATLNKEIAKSAAVGEDASALRDERDSAVRSLGESIGARAIEDKDGNYTVFALGTALVDSDSASSLSASVDATNRTTLTLTRPGGSTLDVRSAVREGTLGGLVEARDSDAVAVSTSLDSFAFDFANGMNALHATGFGLDGVSGRNLYATSATATGAASALQLDPAMVGHPERIGASSSAGKLPGGGDIALALGAMADSPLAGGGKPVDRLAAILGDVGVRKSKADDERAVRVDTVAQTETLETRASGVSIDEEMVDLTKYQRAYEASVRMLRAVDELLDGLIKSV